MGLGLIKIFISAVEPSGDVLGAELMRSLKAANPHVEFYGLGGPLMIQEGLTALFPIDDLAIMGFTEVLPKLYQVFKRIRQTINHITALNPDMVITIDGLSFHTRVIKKIQHLRAHIPFIQYVAPAVWAWKPGRAKKIATLFDKLLVIFPFEPPYFEEHGLSTTFIGHPVTERFTHKSAEKLQKPDSLQIVLLPGSRVQEIRHHLGIFLKAAHIIAQEIPQCRFILPTVPGLVSIIEKQVKETDLPIQIITDAQEKYASFINSDFAIAASGTVSLELAMARLPAIIAYKASQISYEIAKRVARVRFICMVNILLDDYLVPELIQHECKPELIAQTALEIIRSPQKLEQFRQRYHEAIHKLSPPKHKNPSLYASDVIYNCLKMKQLRTP